MAAAPQQPERSAQHREKGTAEVAGELWDLLKTYARQETVDPIKGVGRFLTFGVPGSILLAMGGLFLSLGLLRALQTQTGQHLTGHLNWVPYLVTLVVAGLLAALATRAIGRTGKREKGTNDR